MKNKKFSRLIFASAIYFTLSFFILGCNSTEPVQPVDLRVEYLTNPLGVDVEQPRFSWQIVSEERDVKQSAYRIIVDESLSEVKEKTGSVWDSGKISGDKTVNVEFSGGPLQSNTTYFWRVRVWLDDETSIWSEPASFHTGILDENEWQAQWITTQEEIVHASPLLRKQFQVEKEIDRAYVFVTATGFYELYLNGEKVGNHVLDPGITDYRKTVRPLELGKRWYVVWQSRPLDAADD
jgi:alpha-L-rhamnosidase